MRLPARCATGLASTAVAPPPTASRRGSTKTWAPSDLAEEAAERAALRGPSDAGAWERLGRLRLQLVDREGALEALRRALALGAGKEVHDLVAQALAIEPSMAG